MNKMLLLSLVVSYIRKRGSGPILPLGKLLAYVHTVDATVLKIQVEDVIQEIIASGMVTEIEYYDVQRETLHLN